MRLGYDNYIEKLILGGYVNRKDLEPVKCTGCESKNVVDSGVVVEELGTHIVTDCERVCDDCGKVLGSWSFGIWDV